MTEYKDILIVRTDRIGDVVLTLPLAGIIKKRLPHVKVTFLLKEYTSPLAKINPFVDEILTLDEKYGRTALFSNLKQIKNRFDCAVVAYPTFKIALLLFLAGIKTRVGSGYRWYSFLFNKKVYEHRKNAKHHELEYNVHLLKQIGIDEKVDRRNVEFNLQPHHKSRQSVESALAKLGIDPSKKLVIIHPGSGGSSIDFPLNSMKELIELMARQLDYEILITGAESEIEICDSLVVNKSVKNAAGLFELGELTALIDRCDLLIANSTGPIHIAAALGKYVIGFYPKVVTCSKERWGPYTERSIIFEPAIDCKDCTIDQCKKLNCMESINVGRVFEAVKSILECRKKIL